MGIIFLFICFINTFWVFTPNIPFNLVFAALLIIYLLT